MSLREWAISRRKHPRFVACLRSAQAEQSAECPPNAQFAPPARHLQIQHLIAIPNARALAQPPTPQSSGDMPPCAATDRQRPEPRDHKPLPDQELRRCNGQASLFAYHLFADSTVKSNPEFFRQK